MGGSRQHCLGHLKEKLNGHRPQQSPASAKSASGVSELDFVESACYEIDTKFWKLLGAARGGP